MNGVFVAVLVACCLIDPALFIVLAGILIVGVLMAK